MQAKCLGGVGLAVQNQKQGDVSGGLAERKSYMSPEGGKGGPGGLKGKGGGMGGFNRTGPRGVWEEGTGFGKIGGSTMPHSSKGG